MIQILIDYIIVKQNHVVMQKNFSISLTVFFLILIFTGCNKKQDSFVIVGEVTEFEDSTKIYLSDPDAQKKIDSTFVVDGQFKFEGKVESPGKLSLMSEFEQGERPAYKSFWVDNSSITVKGNYENFNYAEISGSEPQKTADILLKETKQFRKERDSLTERYRELYRQDDKKEEINAIVSRIHKIDSLTELKEMQFIKEHTNSYAAVEQLKFKMTQIPQDTLQKYYDKLSPEFKETQYGKVLHTHLNSRLAEKGGQYIDFEAKTIEGEKFKLSEIKDKYILLNFWSSNCGGCRMANKALAEKYAELKDHIELVGFNVDKNKETIKKAIDKDSIMWTTVTTLKGLDGEIPVRYQIRGVPTFFMINPDGEIIDKFLGYRENKIEEIKKIALKE